MLIKKKFRGCFFSFLLKIDFPCDNQNTDNTLSSIVHNRESSLLFSVTLPRKKAIV